MSISSISSQSPTSYQSPLESSFRQRSQDFKALSSALQSGNLSDAQTAFAAFEQGAQGGAQPPAGTAATPQQAQVSQDLQSLSTALKSGDISSAQKAFASLKQDFKAMSGSHGHHGHHHSKVNDGDGDDAANAPGAVSAAAASTAASDASSGTLLSALA